jgi:hypothetical protein
LAWQFHPRHGRGRIVPPLEALPLSGGPGALLKAGTGGAVLGAWLTVRTDAGWLYGKPTASVVFLLLVPAMFSNRHT